MAYCIEPVEYKEHYETAYDDKKCRQSPLIVLFFKFYQIFEFAFCIYFQQFPVIRIFFPEFLQGIWQINVGFYCS